jgi:YjbE family integral membrane protein
MMDFLFLASAAAPHTAPLAGMWALIVADFGNLGSASALSALLQVLIIDITLAGDNAIVVGALAAGLPAEQRRKVILIGVIAALILRVFFALVVTQLLQVVGLVLAGGLLLLWVAWKMWREMRHSEPAGGSPEIEGDEHSGVRPAKSFASAAWAVAVADVSMSLDNVLGVASAAKNHPGIMIVGLIFAVALMGIAANVIAKYIERFRWIAWVGVVVILWVAGTMVYEGFMDPKVGIMSILG